MDHTRDNPLKRFKAFWIALLLVFSFGVALLFLRPFTHGETDSAMTVAGKARLEVKEEFDRAQDSALNTGALDEAISGQLESFSQNTPTKGAKALPEAAPVPQADPAAETTPATE